jgi:sphingosine kinase
LFSYGANVVIVTQFSDGYMDAVIVKDCPKADLLGLLMKMGDGSYVKSPYVTYLKVRFHPLESATLQVALAFSPK